MSTQEEEEEDTRVEPVCENCKEDGPDFDCPEPNFEPPNPEDVEEFGEREDMLVRELCEASWAASVKREAALRSKLCLSVSRFLQRSRSSSSAAT